MINLTNTCSTTNYINNTTSTIKSVNSQLDITYIQEREINHLWLRSRPNFQHIHNESVK